MLIDIVAKGGNLLYNIGPAPDGSWPEDAYKLLDAMGKWIGRETAKRFYSTRAIAPFKTDNICLTQQKDSESSLRALPGAGRRCRIARFVYR